MHALLVGCLLLVPAAARQVAQVRVVGCAALDSLTVVRTAGLSAPSALTSVDLAEAVRRLYRSGLVDDVQVFESPGPGGSVLTLVVRERPPLASISFSGNKRLSTSDLEKKVPLVTGQRVSRARLEAYVSTIREAYRAEGYLRALVSCQLDTTDTGVHVTYLIKEGPKVRIRRVEVTGVQAFEPGAVAKKSKVRPKGFLRSGKFDREKVEEGSHKIEEFYRNRGFLDASVSSYQLHYTPDSTGVVVVYPVEEGEQFLVGSFSVAVEDSVDYPQDKLLALVRLSPGEPFNYSKLEQAIRKMYELFQEEGRLWARIVPEEQRRQDRVDYAFRITQGPAARVRLITIQGNTTTKEKVIRRELVVFPGEQFRRSALVRSHREVYNLGYFEDVSVDYENATPEGEVDFVVKVKEKSSGQLNFGVTYSSQTRLLGFIQVAHPNVLGNGWATNLRWEFGKRSQNVEFGFTEPWFLDTPTSLGFDLYNTRTSYYYADYTVRRRGGAVRVGRPVPWFDYVSASAGYSLSDVKVIPDADYTGPELAKGWKTTSRILFQVTRDSRDNVFEPSKGSRTVLSNELAGRALGGDVAFHKVELQSAWFNALAPKLIASVSLRAGSVVGFPTPDQVPVYERFRPGGTSSDGTVRGYEDYSLGPVDASGYTTGGRVAVVLNAELRVPLVPEQVALLAFVDAGNAWRSFGELDLNEMKRGAGLGVRINTGVLGVIGLDYAYGFDQPKPGWRPHFQFGMFM